MAGSTSRIWILAITLLSGCQSFSGGKHSVVRSEGEERSFRVEYTARVRGFPAGARLARVWIPVPQSSEAQEISNLGVTGLVDFELATEPLYGNRMLYFDLAAPLPREIEVTLSYDVKRREIDRVSRLHGAKMEAERARLLEGDRLAALTSEVRRRAREAAGEERSVLSRARGIYERVLADVRYDKSGQGWGRGDIDYVCDAGKGNCSDFHSLFVAMCRAREIPAVFEIGFSLPSKEGVGTVGGYHCWAWFRDGSSWRPVDVSEADKSPERADYFFGTICENRIALSLGRDLVLTPPQRGEPLNFFVYPYVEVDGEPDDVNVSTTFRYRESS